MAHIAGEAYAGPPAGQGYRTSEIFGLPVMTFYDKTILCKMFAGVLEVTLVGARNLRPPHLGGLPDAYAVVSMGGGSFRSRTCKNSINPTWNETKALFVCDPDTDALCIRVFDDDNVTHHDDLGVAVLGLGSRKAHMGDEGTFKLPLRGPNGDMGRVMLKCRLKLFKDVDPDTLKELKPPGEANGTDGEPDLREGKKRGRETALRPVAFVNDKGTDTQVWVRWRPEDRMLACAFRGTEANKIKDIITDIRLVKCAFHNLDGDVMSGVRIHKGVMVAYNSVRRTLANLLHVITALHPGDSDQRPWRVLLTGHSLGAGLATLAAFELSMYKSKAGHIGRCSLFTFGSPRVGNATLAEFFDRIAPFTWRFTNEHDIVPSVPPDWLGYRHVGHPVRIRADHTVNVGPNSLLVNAAEQLGIAGLPQEGIMKGVISFTEKALRDVRPIAAGLSRRAIKEHYPSYYTAMMDEVLAKQRESLAGTHPLPVPAPSPDGAAAATEAGTASPQGGEAAATVGRAERAAPADELESKERSQPDAETKASVALVATAAI